MEQPAQVPANMQGNIFPPTIPKDSEIAMARILAKRVPMRIEGVKVASICLVTSVPLGRWIVVSVA